MTFLKNAPLLSLLTTCMIAAVFSGGLRASATFEADVHPFFQQYCLECHNSEDSKGGMDLEVIRRSEDFMSHPTALTYVIEQLEFGDMPPRKAKQPTEEELEAAIDWLNGELNRQRNATPNDPGIVVAPRLNSAEYGNAIRYLFETDRFDASNFITPEGGAGEGFANVGEAQSMVTSQFESYLTAAGRVLSHARITPQAGFSWSAAPQGASASRDDLIKGLVQNWTDWFSVKYDDLVDRHMRELSQSTRMAWGAYAQRAWEFEHASELRLPWRSIEEAAAGAEPKLYPTVLEIFYTSFTGKGDGGQRRVLDSRYLATLRERWSELSPSRLSDPKDRMEAFKELEKFGNLYTEDARWSKDFSDLIDLENSGLNYRDVNQPWEGGVVRFPLDLSKATTGEVVLSLSDSGDGNEEDYVLLTDGRFKMADGSQQDWQTVLPNGLKASNGRTLSWGSDMAPGSSGLSDNQIGVQAPLFLSFDVPQGAEGLIFTVKFHPKYKNSSVTPAVDDKPLEMFEGRLLGHRVMGAGQSKRADRVADSFRGIQAITSSFGRFGRAEGNSAFTDLKWLNQEKARKLGIDWPQDEYLGRRSIFFLKPTTVIAEASPEEQEALLSIGEQLEELAQSPDPAAERLAAAQLLSNAAEKAWRRPPTPEELQGLGKLYTSDRDAGLTYDFAVKTALKAILVSPEFLYRFQNARHSSEPYLIDNLDMADRLAFFLWSSPPDEELIQVAREGLLHDPTVLKAQAKRMLDDPRANALATQFAAQWLKFADFDTFTGPDTAKFPEFTDPVKQAMYDEARLFTLDLLQNNRPLTNLIQADYTFANETLAEVYDLSDEIKGPEMRKVSTVGTPRGGILTMGSVLTNHSAPLRTSQVKRGVWVYEQILGVNLPEPPPNVEQLSDTETNEDGLTIAQQLEVHRSKPECASCHAKFDALGFALENFDPMGRWRTEDGAGNPLETQEMINGDQVIDGLAGLQAYIQSRMDDVIRTYCRKLAGFALGRGLIISDQTLIEEMFKAVKANGNRPQMGMAVLLESRQFRYRRDEPDDTSVTANLNNTHPGIALPQ